MRLDLDRGLRESGLRLQRLEITPADASRRGDVIETRAGLSGSGAGLSDSTGSFSQSGQHSNAAGPGSWDGGQAGGRGLKG